MSDSIALDTCRNLGMVLFEVCTAFSSFLICLAVNLAHRDYGPQMKETTMPY